MLNSHCDFIIAFLANSWFILWFSHSRTFKMRYKEFAKKAIIKLQWEFNVYVWFDLTWIFSFNFLSSKFQGRGFFLQIFEILLGASYEKKKLENILLIISTHSTYVYCGLHCISMNVWWLLFRTQDIERWRKQLEKTLNEVNSEIGVLQEAKESCERAYEVKCF